MDVDTTAGLIGLAWLLWACALMGGSVRAGQRLADDLARSDPQRYEANGRPRPGMWPSARRSRFARFVALREYESLEDPGLVARFAEHRRRETRTLVRLLLGLALAAVTILFVRR